jgi:hypothetical protein
VSWPYQRPPRLTNLATTKRITERSVFDPEAIEGLDRAYKDTCEALRPHDNSAKEAIARRILGLARGGVLDPTTLRDRIVTEG